MVGLDTWIVCEAGPTANGLASAPVLGGVDWQRRAAEAMAGTGKAAMGAFWAKRCWLVPVALAKHDMEGLANGEILGKDAAADSTCPGAGRSSAGPAAEAALSRAGIGSTGSGTCKDCKDSWIA